MKTFLKFTALSVVLLILAIGFVSCDEQNECNPIPLNIEDCWAIFGTFAHDSSASIVGKWTLKKAFSGWKGQSCWDYSQCNIIYEFRPDGSLIISGRPAGLPVYHRGNRHSYSIIDLIWPSGTPGVTITYPGIRIGNWEYQLTLSSNEMIISQAAHDGSTFYFVRITTITN